MLVKLVYKDIKDKEYFENITLSNTVFIEYIDINTLKGKKEGWKLMNYYGTSTFPFIELEKDNIKIPFYSENGNAINQLINYDRNIIQEVK